MSSARRNGVKAKAGILVDAATGQILWARARRAAADRLDHQGDDRARGHARPGGLNQQIMGAEGVVGYVAKYGAEAASFPGQTVHIRPAAAHHADHVGRRRRLHARQRLRSRPARVHRQDERGSGQLGLADTHFTSPDGLPYPTEFSTYSTPAELVTLGEAAMRNPAFRSIVDLKCYNLPKGNGHKAVAATSDDIPLGRYAGLIGIKTGYTNAAAHTLLFEAVRNGRN